MVLEEIAGGGGGAQICPICLEPVYGEAFLDRCFHIYCYHCILQWTEMALARPQSSSSRLESLKCPLCKTPYTSIIHDLSGAKFQRHFILTFGGTRFGEQAGTSSRKQETAMKGVDWHATISTSVRPFVFEHAEKFAEELGSFLVSGLNIAAYDQHSELVVSAADDSNLRKDSDIPVSYKALDLYDSDIDDDGFYHMVRSPIVEAESHSSDEKLEDMEHHNHRRDTSLEGQSYSQRESVKDRPRSAPIKRFDFGDGDGYRGRSRHKTEASKKRKKGHGLGSSSSRDRQRETPGSETSQRSNVRKNRPKSSQKAKGGSYTTHSKRRTSFETCSNSSGDMDSSRSSTSQSLGELEMEVKVIKEGVTSAMVVARKSGGIRDHVQRAHAEQTGVDQGMSHCQHQHASGVVAAADNLEPLSHSPERLSRYLGTEGPRDLLKHQENGYEESLSSIQVADRRTKEGSPSSNPAVRSHVPGSESMTEWFSPSLQVDFVRLLSKPSPDKQLPSAQVLDDHDQEVTTLELKLRDEALTNFKMHLSQKKEAEGDSGVI